MLTILYYMGAIYTFVFALCAILMVLCVTEILPRKYQKWYLLHLAFMIACVAVFFWS